MCTSCHYGCTSRIPYTYMYICIPYRKSFIATPIFWYTGCDGAGVLFFAGHAHLLQDVLMDAAGCDGADVLIIMSARETMIVRSLTSREAPYVFPVYISRVSTALSHSLCELTELPSTRHGSGHDLYHYALSCRCPVLAASGSLWSSLRSVVPAVPNKPCTSVRKVSCCC